MLLNFYSKYPAYITIVICIAIALFDLPWGYFFIALGTLPLALTIMMLVVRIKKIKKYEKVMGKIIEIIEKEERFKNEAKTYMISYPVISYTTYSGKKITAQSGEGISPCPAVGTEVLIGYDPEQPEKFILIDSNYLLESIFGGVGLLFIIIGACAVIL
ncbi:MAG: DUF3592 domain-containing protein [Bacteroidia bacterium]